MIRYRKLIVSATLVTVFACVGSPAFAVSKDMIQLQTQIQQLQDAIARLQQSNDERMGVLKDLVQQSADSVNKMSAGMSTLQQQLQSQQEAQGRKVEQVSGQVQALNDSLDEIKARLQRLEKLMQDVQGQQQTMSASMQGLPATGGLSTSPQTNVAPPVSALPASPTTGGDILPPTPYNGSGRRVKPSAAIPDLPTSNVPGANAAAPPADDLYKTALGDYMAAKYALAQAEFGDVARFYPDNPLSGNAFYYQGEIDYRAGRYAASVKDYDRVLEQYPDSNKVPVAHLHKGQALIQLKQNDAGARELRSLIQRFPNSPEAMQARSKLSGMGIPVTPRRAQ
jgi:TolA-binding protein